MWYAVFFNTTKKLFSVGTVIADPLPAHLSSVELGEEKSEGQWNSISLQFEIPIEPREPLTPLEFMRRFTVQEEAAIRTSARTDAIVEVFLSRLDAAQLVHLDNPETIAGVNYCVSINAITAMRGSEILNG